MTQLDLLTFAHSHARTTDPATSHAAARQAVSLASAHQAKIMAYLRRIHPNGDIYEGIATATGLEPHAAARRLPELQQAGLAEPLDKTIATKARRMARVWRAVMP